MSGARAPQGDPYPSRGGTSGDNLVAAANDDIGTAKTAGAGIGDDEDASGRSYQLQARS